MMFPADSVIFDRRNLGVNYSWPSNFYQPSIFCGHRSQLSQWCYLAYRFVVLIYYSAWEIRDAVAYQSRDAGPYFLIYLTHWQQTALCLHLLLAFIATFWSSWSSKKVNCNLTPKYAYNNQWFPNLTWFLKVCWVTREVAFTAAFSVTVLFFSFLYSPHSTRYNNASSFNAHLINSMIVLIDIAVSAAPIRLYHFWMPTILAAIYASFTGVFYAVGGKNEHNQSFIYSVIDYQTHPGKSAGFAVGFSLGFVPIAHAILSILDLLKTHITKKLTIKSQEGRFASKGCQENQCVKNDEMGANQIVQVYTVHL